MAEFHQELVKIVIDKVLLCGSGVLVSLITAKWIERHRREQAIIVELGKLRAAALVRLISFLSEADLLLNTILSLGPSEAHAGARQIAEQRFAELKEKVSETIGGSGAILNDEIAQEIARYNFLVFVEGVGALSGTDPIAPKELENKREQTREMRSKLLAYLPPLQPIDRKRR
ncbi:hypothetical protein [Cystobacter fuscus]|uniref:hypothetical protein n=1 Tax=Cystobacter fuscus TaxID=43 RepID=UPI002B31820A|nr:hypothetical protein F0U63_30230 [Cystobacter fuscus]